MGFREEKPAAGGTGSTGTSGAPGTSGTSGSPASGRARHGKQPRSEAERREIRQELIRRFKRLRVYAGIAFVLALLGLAYYIRKNFDVVTDGNPRFAFTYVLIAVVVALSLALFFSSTKLIMHYQKLLDSPAEAKGEREEDTDEEA